MNSVKYAEEIVELIVDKKLYESENGIFLFSNYADRNTFTMLLKDLGTWGSVISPFKTHLSTFRYAPSFRMITAQEFYELEKQSDTFTKALVDCFKTHNVKTHLTTPSGRWWRGDWGPVM